MTKPKIDPFVSAGEVFLHNDGKTWDVVPLSVYTDRKGWTIIRVGRNTFFFNEDGVYDGSECSAGFDADPEALTETLKLCAENRNRRPVEAYFEKGSRGYADETAIWPAKDSIVQGARSGEKTYVFPHGNDEGNN